MMKCSTGAGRNYMTERRLNISVLILLIISFLLILNGCTKTGREADLSISENLANTKEWCVISVPYAAFKREPSTSSEVVEHGRRSDIFEITGKRYITENKETIIWYQFNKGWLPESSVMIYENQLKAKTAAESMKE